MKVSTEIKKVAEANNIPMEILELEQMQKIKSSICQKYISKSKSSFLWDKFINSSVVNNKDGWELIADFVGQEKCLMFFDDCEDRSVIAINEGEDLHKLLYETYGFEFYITNYATEYLICFNHHDCLIGCGTAKNWVDTLKK